MGQDFGETIDDQLAREVQETGAELKEGGLVERLGKDVGDVVSRGNPLGLRHLVEPLLAAIHHPGLVVLGALGGAGLHHGGDGGVIFLIIVVRVPSQRATRAGRRHRVAHRAGRQIERPRNLLDELLVLLVGDALRLEDRRLREHDERRHI